MLGVLGDLVEDVVVWPSGPVAPGTDTAAQVFRRRGGSAANVAAHAARIAPVRFLGQVGDDDAGRALTASLADDGVDVRVRRAGRTGTVVVLVDADGERTMLPDRGAAAELCDPPAAWADGLTHLHLPAYSLVAEPVRGAALAVAARVGSVSVDVASTGAVRACGVERFAALLRELRPAHVLATLAEADLLGLPGSAPAGTVVVVKDGPRPARVTAPGRPAVVVPVPPVGSVRDTTGAGDAFAAGYLQAVVGGAEPVEACRNGHRTARTVLTVPGAG
ncbi:carbohydrate kinase family protein [Pseudonocardia endophytica]|uniref:Sugar/nucleoside kinase (Ribokinase family) n=1 Tax=Pseudonocardia endophytica TaxID=401976 RepID=A0A4R1HQJ6_PSEEN|nr:carbohydrate kinase family protein [Pseudonocardia endophytica]TCK24874.1 sugar/nucleoside kinase (ribokinase family) [Pseudonocardia endophytica]